MENKDEIHEHFKRYLEGKATVAEAYNLLAYFDTQEGGHHLQELVNQHFDHPGDVPPALLKRVNAITHRVDLKLQQSLFNNCKTRKLWKTSYTLVAIAASIMLAIAAYLLINSINKKEVFVPGTVQLDAEPGTNKAILTLADGSRINLDGANKGQVANQAGIKITKTADGQLLYTVIDQHNATTANNTLTTPKGGTYQVRLPDGSKVWLNAASTLTYPTDLSISKTRVVQLSGEAYFEVAPDKARPFIVKTATQEVKVLGTHFNVNSYGDDSPTITTLAEGSVRVSTLHGTKQSLVLKPKEQAIQTNALTVQPADLESALAWKNGLMLFKSEPLENIMKQVERWYNVEVIYDGQVRKRVFTGSIPRSAKLSALLSVLKDSDINFELKQTPQGKALLIKQ